MLGSSIHEIVWFTPPSQTVLATGAVVCISFVVGESCMREEREGEKLTNGVAKAKGKTVAKANNNVAARIAKESKESASEREWTGLLNSWHKRKTDEGTKERRRKVAER